MGGVVGVIRETAGFIIRNWGVVKNFLITCLKVLVWIEKIIYIGRLLIKLIRSAGRVIARFFSGDDEVGSSSADLHNIDEVINLAEDLENRYS